MRFPHLKTIKRTAALLGAAVLIFAASPAPAAQTSATGPAFLQGKVHDLSGRGANLEARFEAARVEAAKAPENETFFAAALFQAIGKIRFGRGDEADGPFLISAADSRIKIKHNASGGYSIDDNDDGTSQSPAVWLLLCEAKTGRPVDVRLLSPEQKFTFDSTSVYWLGNVPGAESLAFFEKRLQAQTEAKKRERLLYPISRHAEPRAYDVLFQAALGDPASEVRKQAVFWIGTLSDARGLSGLKEIMRKERNMDIREHVVFSMSLRKEKEAVVELIRIAREDTDDSLREKAVFWLGQKASNESVKALKDIVQSPTEEDKIKQQAVFAISQLPKEKAVPMLLDMAKNNKNAAVRKQAIFWLGQTGDPAALKFFEEILLKK